MMDRLQVEEKPFADLTPDRILDAVDSLGMLSSGQLLALNSYENRVYQVGIENGQPLIVKFYRPQRWSNAAILEEHAFAWRLVENDIPVVPPLKIKGVTLHESGAYRFAVYERKPGHAPDVSFDSDLQQLGRLLARIHLTGKHFPFEHRERLNAESRGFDSQHFILQHDFLPDYLRTSYEQISTQLLALIKQQFDLHQSVRFQSIHGDFHLGNILSDGQQFFIVDLDDCITGPVVQDLWMLLSGETEEKQHQLSQIMQGYRQFNDFDAFELGLIEALKALRLIYYAAWLARRWQDPAFPQAFPWFNTPRYWEEHIQALQEQLYNMQNQEVQLFLP